MNASYAQIECYKDRLAVGILERISRDIDNEDTTILKLGGQDYCQKMFDREHNELVRQVSNALSCRENEVKTLVISGIWTMM